MHPECIADAVTARNAGLRRIRKLTWRAGAGGLAFSALIAAAFGHAAAGKAAASRAEHSIARPSHAGHAGAHHRRGGTHHRYRHRAHRGTRLSPPPQPPASSSGPGQVVTGGS